ncbi:hypothetical protein ABPG72_011020 [Tetrahymena utriculariae]
MNLAQYQNPLLQKEQEIPSSGRESSGRGLYEPPQFNNKQKKEKKLEQYINESFHQEQEQKYTQAVNRKKNDSQRQKHIERILGKPQKKSLSESGSVEDYKMQTDDKRSGSGSFENNFREKNANFKHTIFTQGEHTQTSLTTSYIMNTDFWALSYTKNQNNKKSYFVKLLLLAGQSALFLLLEWVPFIISLHFIGTSDDSATTGGYGMGIVWSNCFIEFVFGGLGLGLQILVMQAIQEERMNQAMNLFKKGIVIVTISMIPIIILMFLSGFIIEGISGNNQLGNYTYQYCTYGIPAFYFNGIYNILKGFLRAKNQGILAFISISFAAVSSIFWNWFFILKIDSQSEVIGAALARDVIEAINVIMLFIFLYNKNKKEDKFSLKLTKLAFKGWSELTKFCLPIGGLLFLEWIGYELFTFQATHLSDSEFSAHVIFNIFNTVYYQIAYGISIAITSQVNQEMEVSDLVSSLKYSKYGILITFIYIFITMLPMAFLGDPFSRAFTNDAESQQTIQQSYGLFLTCLAMDAVLASIVGITRGIGKQKIAAIIFILSFLVLGQILASIFSYLLDGGVIGIWLSILASIFIANFSQAIWTGFTDWEKSLIDLQSFKQNEEKERKRMMLERIKSHNSLIQYEDQYLDTDEDIKHREEKSQAIQPPPSNNQLDRYNTDQVIVEKEENNSTINNTNNNTFMGKLSSKNTNKNYSNTISSESNNDKASHQNNVSSIFKQNAINSSDKIKENSLDDLYDQQKRHNLQDITQEDISHNSKIQM